MWGWVEIGALERRKMLEGHWLVKLVKETKSWKDGGGCSVTGGYLEGNINSYHPHEAADEGRRCAAVNFGVNTFQFLIAMFLCSFHQHLSH